MSPKSPDIGSSALAALAFRPQPDLEAQRINLAWLVRLRWGAVIGQLVTILLVSLGLRFELPLGPLFVLLALEATSNIGCMIWARQKRVVRMWALGIVIAVDMLMLTALLYLTGGPSNPFSFLYLVHIALAAVVLPASYTWSLVGLSLACFGLLFWQPEWVPEQMQTHMNHADQMRMHMQGMWIAFGVAAVFITYFVTRVRESLAEREIELSRARTLASQSEKLASLATLATGAAHELSTPLSTIAVVAKELARAMQDTEHKSARDDAQLIRSEVERCREILQRMAADAGQPSDHDSEPLRVRELLRRVMDGLGQNLSVKVEVDDATADSVLHAPAQATAQALRAVLKNALQASENSQPVRVSARTQQGRCVLEVRDFGSGMSAEILSRAGEPFFTTKGPGDGMGLGLFLARAVVERAGGSVTLDSTPGSGTTAALVLPFAAAANRRMQV
ncbi:MAG TPA: ATP-binding protein [Polyangiales bacterium]|nr:ATP-binding protein [Polyangiales bacterium]